MKTCSRGWNLAWALKTARDLNQGEEAKPGRGCWSWNSITLATWCKELTHLKRPWCWERLKVDGEGDDRGWDGWMASLMQRTWVWVCSGSWWWTGKPGRLQSMVAKSWTRLRDWTELNRGSKRNLISKEKSQSDSGSGKEVNVMTMISKEQITVFGTTWI